MKKRYIILMLMIAVSGISLTSCYKQFDPKSYQPKFTISGFSSVDQIKPTNLVGYWAFQGGLADSVSGTVATNNGTAFANGFIGQGLSLNVDNSSYVIQDPSSALKGMQSFTISFWVNPTFVDSNNDGTIDGILGMIDIANPNDFWGYLDWFVENGSSPSSATLKFHLRGGSTTSDTFIQQTGVTNFFGKWSNQTLVYDASTSMVTYYMNGSVLIPATTVPWTGPLDFSSIGPLIFGTVQFQVTPSLGTAGSAQPWASYLTGTMDEVRIYNAALTADEVNALVVLQGKSSSK